MCGTRGDMKYTYHDVDGKPVVDTSLFPDFNAMTDYAHSLGLTAGYVSMHNYYLLKISNCHYILVGTVITAFAKIIVPLMHAIKKM